MIIYIIGLIIGLLIAGFGIYYLAKEKDAQSKNIYRVTTVIGIIIAVFFVMRMFL